MQFEIRYPDTVIELIPLFKPCELLISEFEKNSGIPTFQTFNLLKLPILQAKNSFDLQSSVFQLS